MEKQEFIINRIDDEAIEITLDGVSIAYLTHDSDGWQGMEQGESIVKTIAGILGIPVKYTEGRNDEE